MQITDSINVVLDLMDRTRVGDPVWRQLGVNEAFVHCLHSVGGKHEGRRLVCRLPSEHTIWAFGPGYQLARSLCGS